MIHPMNETTLVTVASLRQRLELDSPELFLGSSTKFGNCAEEMAAARQPCLRYGFREFLIGAQRSARPTNPLIQ
jgi:hypothetical protein